MRYALRTLLRQPLFTLSAVVTLALGIGVNSTIFTFANGALFRPRPGITNPGELVWITSASRTRGGGGDVSYPDFADYREGTRDVFGSMLAFRSTPLNLGTGEPQRIRGQFVSGDYFTGLGVGAAAGRLLGPSDEREGSPPTAVISHRLWRNLFDASPDAVSSSIIVNGRAVAVVGVAAEDFTGPALDESADAWLPLSALPTIKTNERNMLTDRGTSGLLVIGRLRSNVSPGRAQAAVNAVAARLEQAYPETNTGRLAVLASAAAGLPPEARGEFVPLTALMLTVTGIVLLIACANVANLLLARGAARSSEIGIRAAIGASRAQLLRQLLTESALLGAAGAIGGLILSFWASDLLLSTLPESEFRGFEVGPDLLMLAFTTTIAALSVGAFGIVPALSATRQALLPRLQQANASGGRSRLQGVFVVAQLSLSLVLLLAGGLSLRAVQKSRALDLGFDPSGVLTASYDLQLQNYPAARRAVFRQELRDRLSALPGVTAVALANVPPLSGTMVGTVVSSTDTAGGPTESSAYLNGVGPGYFEALRIPLLRGRGLLQSDLSANAPVAVVNETLAQRLWSSVDVVGRHLTLDNQVFDVIGVARDSKYDEATEDPRPFFYTSLGRAILERETVLVRTQSSPAALASSLRDTVRALDPALPLFAVSTMDDVLRERADKQRAISTLLGAFGGVALLLASLGLYGVMSYAVTRRTREIGVRVALGATPAQISSLVAYDGLRLALVGVVIGGMLALPMAVALGALLFGVQIADLAAFVAICALLVGVAFFASVLPARRAARLDPVLALRTE